jgi:hypothetical protein
MGMSGMLAQMGLGAAANVGQGIGDRIRKEAAAAREAALNDQKFGQAQELEATRFSNNEAIADKQDAQARERTKNDRQWALDQRDQKTDLYIDDSGNLVENGTGVPAFQRGKDGSLTDLRRTGKGGDGEDSLHRRQTIESRLKELHDMDMYFTKRMSGTDESGNPIQMSEKEISEMNRVKDQKRQLINELNLLTGGKQRTSTSLDPGKVDQLIKDYNLSSLSGKDLDSALSDADTIFGSGSADLLRARLSSGRARSDQAQPILSDNKPKEKGLLQMLSENTNPSFAPQYAVSNRQPSAEQGMTAKGADKAANRTSITNAAAAIERDIQSVGGSIDQRQIPYYAEEMAKRHKISVQQAQELITQILGKSK